MELKDEPTVLKMPDSIVTMIDLYRLERELESIENFAIQSAVRKAGKQPELPKISRSIEDLAEQNKINLLKDEERGHLISALKVLKKRAPVIHVSFAAEPSASFTAKIINWFRTEIHPDCFLQIGLQPNIAAGCIVRTTNKQFDLSLRQQLTSQQQLLIDKLSKGN